MYTVTIMPTMLWKYGQEYINSNYALHAMYRKFSKYSSDFWELFNDIVMSPQYYHIIS